MSIVADFLVAAIQNWLSLAGIAAAFVLRRRIRALPLPQLRDWQACALVAAVSLAASIAAAALHGMPLPSWHDDFSYLLAADTFVHGRLANPPHPLSDFFETMHVLQHPTYASKYPPGQGAVLALGLLVGQPLVAMWLLAAAACAATWWALRAWLSPELALLGGLLAAIHPTMFAWAESYHGGALAALAGALLLGAIARRMDVVAGLAIALFAYSRPFEGLVFTIAAVVALRPPRVVRMASIAAVALVPLAVYNPAVTGSAFVLPYTVYEQRYDPVPPFAWGSPRRVAPEPNLEMATIYRLLYAAPWRHSHEPGGMRADASKKVDAIQAAVFGGRALILLLPLIAWPRAFRDGRVRRLSLLLLLFAFAPFAIAGILQSHYLGPATAAAAILMTLLIAELPPSFALAALVAFAINAGAAWIGFARSHETGPEVRRRAVASSVDGVVIVAPEVFDMVYNGADIDRQRVIWARDLGPRNAALRAYYRDRKFWYLPTDGSSGPGRPRPLP